MKTGRKRGMYGVCRLKHRGGGSRVKAEKSGAAAAAGSDTGSGIPGLYFRVSQGAVSEIPHRFLIEFRNVEAHVQNFCRRHDALKRFNGDVKCGSRAWRILRVETAWLVRDGKEIMAGLQQMQQLAAEHGFRTVRRFEELVAIFAPLLGECENLLFSIHEEILAELDRRYASQLRLQRLIA